MNQSKFGSQAKHIKENYVKFNMNLKPEFIAMFKLACAANGTTATTEIKKFMAEYCEKYSTGEPYDD